VAKKSAARTPIKLLIATRNRGKFREFKHFLSGPDLELLSLNDFPAFKDPGEPYGTFEKNARHKALNALRQSGLISLADDSGLEVEALDNAPGVRSARFAGANAGDRENNRKLLRLLAGAPAEKRGARFRCVLALALSEKELKMVSADARGVILSSARGKRGFGYDPLFYDPRLKKTFAELAPDEKLRVSHRGKALRKMGPVLLRLVRRLKSRKAQS